MDTIVYTKSFNINSIYNRAYHCEKRITLLEDFQHSFQLQDFQDFQDSIPFPLLQSN